MVPHPSHYESGRAGASKHDTPALSRNAVFPCEEGQQYSSVMRQIQLPPTVGFAAALTLVLTALLPTAQSKLADRVAALETEVAALDERVDAITAIKIVTVDCAAGQTVQAALLSV